MAFLRLGAKVGAFGIVMYCRRQKEDNRTLMIKKFMEAYNFQKFRVGSENAKVWCVWALTHTTRNKNIDGFIFWIDTKPHQNCLHSPTF